MEEIKLHQIKSLISELSKELEKNFLISNDGEIKEISVLGCSSGQCEDFLNLCPSGSTTTNAPANSSSE